MGGGGGGVVSLFLLYAIQCLEWSQGDSEGRRGRGRRPSCGGLGRQSAQGVSPSYSLKKDNYSILQHDTLF